MLEKIKEFFKRDWTLAEKILMILCFFYLGVIKGFLFAPIKKGISCGNNNGNNYPASMENTQKEKKKEK